MSCSMMDASSESEWHLADYHGSDIQVYLALRCEKDLSCRSTLQLQGDPKPGEDYALGFRYRFIYDDKSIIVLNNLQPNFIDGNDTTSYLSLPVKEKHIRFTLLDSKNKKKNYDIDVSPWLGEKSETIDSVKFSNFEPGAEICFYKIQEELCNKVASETQEISIPNNSTYYSFFRVKQINKKIEVGKYTDYLHIMTTVYWR